MDGLAVFLLPTISLKTKVVVDSGSLWVLGIKALPGIIPKKRKPPTDDIGRL
jgi:hypothetical protein